MKYNWDGWRYALPARSRVLIRYVLNYRRCVATRGHPRTDIRIDSRPLFIRDSPFGVSALLPSSFTLFALLRVRIARCVVVQISWPFASDIVISASFY